MVTSLSATDCRARMVTGKVTVDSWVIFLPSRSTSRCTFFLRWSVPETIRLPSVSIPEAIRSRGGEPRTWGASSAGDDDKIPITAAMASIGRVMAASPNIDRDLLAADGQRLSRTCITGKAQWSDHETVRVAGAESSKPRFSAQDRGFEDSAPATEKHFGRSAIQGRLSLVPQFLLHLACARFTVTLGGDN